MPSDALRVTTAHLSELASKHDRAASEMTAAAGLVAGVHDRVRISHGVIASPTAAMLATLEEARRAASHSIAGTSDMFRGHLAAAAHRYVTTDHNLGTHINGYAP
jgi:ESX secretion-associated protein EspC/F